MRWTGTSVMRLQATKEILIAQQAIALRFLASATQNTCGR